jgi:hypothetical protein
VVVIATTLDYHNLLVMSVHVAVVVTILLDDDGIFSFRRRVSGIAIPKAASAAKVMANLRIEFPPTQQNADH